MGEEDPDRRHGRSYCLMIIERFDYGMMGHPHLNLTIRCIFDHGRGQRERVVFWPSFCILFFFFSLRIRMQDQMSVSLVGPTGNGTTSKILQVAYDMIACNPKERLETIIVQLITSDTLTEQRIRPVSWPSTAWVWPASVSCQPKLLHLVPG